MGKVYNPGSDADAIIERQMAKGTFSSAEEVIETALRLLEERDMELAELGRLIDEGDGDIATGHVDPYATAEELATDLAMVGSAMEGKVRRS